MNFEDLPTSDNGASAFLEAWTAAYAKRTFQKEVSQLNDEERLELHSRLYNHLYKNLDTLDVKAAALLNACAILATINIFLIQFFFSSAVPIFVGLSAFFSILSLFLCSFVVKVRWTAVSKLRDLSFAEALCEFIITRNTRTRMYLVAWWSMLSSIAFIFFHLLSYVSAIHLSITH